ncbi:MAG: YbaK/EbsC family protein [Nitriliruptoraceae bacterium]
MPATRLYTLLDEQGIVYEVEDHPHAVSAQRLAAAEGISGFQVAKPVLLSVGGELAMAVIPGAELLDLERAHDVFGGNEVRLATEEEFVSLFEDCEAGAEPPFGRLYGLPTFLDEHLRAQERIAFRDGTHTRTVTLAMTDYLSLVEPEIVSIAHGAA